MLTREWDKLISAQLNNGDWSFQSLAWEGPQELIVYDILIQSISQENCPLLY